MSCANPDYFGIFLMFFIGTLGVVALIGFIVSAVQSFNHHP